MGITWSNGTVEYVGAVIEVGSRGGYDYTDYFAVVWDSEKGEPREITYNTDRFAYSDTRVTVDATDAVKAAFEAYIAAQEVASQMAREARRAKEPTKGKKVVVTKGRKVPRGTTGEVIWYGKGARYGYGPAPMRVGIKDATGTVHWTAASNVEVAA